jgi:hypothetical protein
MRYARLLGHISDSGAFGWIPTTNFDLSVFDDGVAVVEVEWSHPPAGCPRWAESRNSSLQFGHQLEQENEFGLCGIGMLESDLDEWVPMVPALDVSKVRDVRDHARRDGEPVLTGHRSGEPNDVVHLGVVFNQARNCQVIVVGQVVRGQLLDEFGCQETARSTRPSVDLTAYVTANSSSAPLISFPDNASRGSSPSKSKGRWWPH